MTDIISEERLIQLKDEAWEMRPYSDRRFPPSLYYRFLQLLAKETHPELSVELGTGGGGASLHLCLGWPEGIVIGIDQDLAQLTRMDFIRETCPNFRFWHGDSSESATQVHELYGDVDILFIDTSHTYEQTCKEFRAWQSCLSDHAVVCLDDMFRLGMDRAWTELPGKKVRLDELHTGAEIGPDGYGGGGFGVIYDLKG